MFVTRARTVRLAAVFALSVAGLVGSAGQPAEAGTSTNCFPPLGPGAICATAEARGGGIACGHVSGQVWCRGSAGSSGRGWSSIGLGPGIATWKGSAAAAWTCTGLCECPQWADCTPAKEAADACSWALGDLDGCEMGASWDLPIVFAFEGTCITYRVTRESSTVATNGFAATAVDQPDPQETTEC